jgi:hypothetical protein
MAKCNSATRARQDLLFRLGKEGVALEAKSQFVVKSAMMRAFVLDGSFFVYVKRRGPYRPSLMMRVVNEELLELWTTR